MPAKVKCAFVERLNIDEPHVIHQVSWADAATLKVDYNESDYAAFLDLLDGDYNEGLETLNGYIWFQDGSWLSHTWDARWWHYQCTPDVPDELKN